MALPKSVQDQLDQAAEIEKQLSGAAEPQTEPIANEAPPAEPVAPVTPQAQAEPPRAVDWEQKYRTLQGMYNAEVPALHASSREMSQKVQQLTQALEELKAAPKTPEKQGDSLVSEQDKEAFGEDLVNLQERIARAVAAPLESHIKQLTDRLARYEGTAEATAQQQAATAEERYFERLSAAIPAWEQINTDQAWIDWLGGRYPGMTQTRQEQLNSARAALDANATVEMFNAYQALTAPQKVANQNQELNRQVAPNKSKSSTVPDQTAATRIWTQDEVIAAMDPRKLRQMSPDEVARVMSEIDTASAEGRVR